VPNASIRSRTMKFKVVRICNSETNTCIPLEPSRFDLERTASRLHDLGYQVENKGLMVMATKDGVEFIIYRTGKLLIHPMAKERTKDAAEEFYSLCVVSVDDP
jgi:TATA-box binding protein (TBP) (component of TFIID and TFIIIB)